MSDMSAPGLPTRSVVNISGPTQRALPPPSLPSARCVPSREALPHTFRASLSPRARPYFLHGRKPAGYGAHRMAGMLSDALQASGCHPIFSMLPRTRSYPPPRIAAPATPDRDRILLPRSKSLPVGVPSSTPTRTVIWLRACHRAPASAGAFFLIRSGQWTECRCANRMADMTKSALLTKRSKSISPLSLRRAPYPPPTACVARHRTRTVLLLLGSRPSGRRCILLPHPMPLLRFGESPINKAPSSDGASFFELPAGKAERVTLNLHGWSTKRAFVPAAARADTLPIIS